MNALSAILLYLNQASTPLERSKPNLADVELSLEKAKTAVKLLQGAKALLEESIFQVADEPSEGTPLPFEITIEQPKRRRG